MAAGDSKNKRQKGLARATVLLALAAAAGLGAIAVAVVERSFDRTARWLGQEATIQRQARDALDALQRRYQGVPDEDWHPNHQANAWSYRRTLSGLRD